MNSPAQADGGLSSPVGEAFDVHLLDAGPRRISVIAALRQLNGLDLRTAKELTENLPQLLRSGLSAEEADQMIAQIARAGGRVEASRQ